MVCVHIIMLYLICVNRQHCQMFDDAYKINKKYIKYNVYVQKVMENTIHAHGPICSLLHELSIYLYSYSQNYARVYMPIEVLKHILYNVSDFLKNLTALYIYRHHRKS